MSQTPPALLTQGDNLSNVIYDNSLREYFGHRLRVTSEAKVLSQIKNSNNGETVVIIEHGFFLEKGPRDALKKNLQNARVPSSHVLFGEDYNIGISPDVTRGQETL